MQRRRQIGLSLIAAAISASLSRSARGESPEASIIREVKHIYIAAQEAVESQDYVLAAERFTEILRRLPESPENRRIRDSVIINVIDAWTYAFERTRDPAGERQFAFLDQADQTLAQYRTDLAEAYGDGASVSAGVEEMAAKLREARESGLESIEIGPCLQPCLQPCLSPYLSPCLSHPPPSRGCHRGADNGVAILGLLALPAIPRRRAEVLASVADVLPPDVVARLVERQNEE